MLKLIQYFSDNQFTRESFLGWYFEDLARHYVKMAKESEWEKEFIPRLVNHPSYQGSTTPAQKIYFQQMNLAHQAQARHNENISR